MKSLVIDKKDLKHNIKQIKDLAKSNYKNENGEDYKIIAVIKGNGYGLGLIQYAKILIDQGISTLAVATIEEGIELREAGIEVDIIELSQAGIKSELKKLIENNIIITIGSAEEANIVNEIGQELEKKVRAHIKIDTGFGRYGFIYNTQIKEIIEVYKNFENIQIEGTFTHFSNSCSNKEKDTKTQFDRFINTIETLKMNDVNPGMLHVCNSSAFLKYKYMHLNAARIGSALTGRILVQNTIRTKTNWEIKN